MTLDDIINVSLGIFLGSVFLLAIAAIYLGQPKPSPPPINYGRALAKVGVNKRREPIRKTADKLAKEVGFSKAHGWRGDHA